MKRPYQGPSDSQANADALARRFWAKVDRRGPNECWPWLAGTDRGYGVLYRDGRMDKASHISLELAGRALASGKRALHRCDNPPCVNPAHLFEGTQADNVRDMRAKSRGFVPPLLEACHRGHPYDEANTRITPSGDRACRACGRLNSMASYHRRRVAA